MPIESGGVGAGTEKPGFCAHPGETLVANADYHSLVEDARRGQIAVAGIAKLLKENDLSPCGQGCGEMGTCHSNLGPSIQKLAEDLGVEKPTIWGADA